ncbi:MAG: T9SS type A sorting domain-containing protein [Brumimicrobium sp.]
MKLITTLFLTTLMCVALSQDFIDTSYTINTETNIEYGTATSFAGADITLEMDISHPTNDVIPSCGRPLALIIHGGAWAAGSKEDGNIKRMREDFAKRGYVTAAINYRLGYFHTDLNKHCNIENWDCMNLADSSEWIRAWYRGVQDAKGALRYLINNQLIYDIDPSNVFVFGESAGAYISMGVAFMDVEAEKPASCGSLSSVNPPHQNLYGTCIEGTAFEIEIDDMDLTRPDLGSVDGSLNPSSSPYIIKGAGSLYGGVFTDLFSEKDYFDVPKLYLYHQPNDLIVPFGRNKLLQGFNSCSVNPGNCAHIQDRPLTYGGSGIYNLIDTLSINSSWKPEIRDEFTSNNADCLQQIATPSTGGHQFDSYWNRTLSMAEFFAEDIGPNDCQTLSTSSNNKDLSKVNVHPNPTDNYLYFTFNEKEASVYIFDTQGKLLKEKNVIKSGDTISIGNLHNGVYYVKVKTASQNTTHKIIKSDR